MKYQLYHLGDSIFSYPQLRNFFRRTYSSSPRRFQLEIQLEGITINFQQMNQIVQLHKSDMDIVVQPGLTYTDLNTAINSEGLFFPLVIHFNLNFNLKAAIRGYFKLNDLGSRSRSFNRRNGFHGSICSITDCGKFTH